MRSLRFQKSGQMMRFPTFLDPEIAFRCPSSPATGGNHFSLMFAEAGWDPEGDIPEPRKAGRRACQAGLWRRPSQSLLDEYTCWLKEKTQVRQVDGWVEITTSYLDRHNDYLQIFVRRQNSGYTLTDAGYILQDLELSGCKLDTAKRKALLMMTLRGFGVKLNRGMLEVHTSAANFAASKHNLIQAMLAVNDLFALATPMTASLF